MFDNVCVCKFPSISANQGDAYIMKLLTKGDEVPGCDRKWYTNTQC